MAKVVEMAVLQDNQPIQCGNQRKYVDLIMKDDVSVVGSVDILHTATCKFCQSTDIVNKFPTVFQKNVGTIKRY